MFQKRREERAYKPNGSVREEEYSRYPKHEERSERRSSDSRPSSSYGRRQELPRDSRESSPPSDKPKIREQMFDILDNGDLSDGERLIGLGLLQIGIKLEPFMQKIERLSFALEDFTKSVKEAAASEDKK